ncbi:MAG: SH3 domain-containing protein [Clostridia bacterium]|nr:SH3 domain-containing protein [Clostridia bacterium]
MRKRLLTWYLVLSMLIISCLPLAALSEGYVSGDDMGLDSGTAVVLAKSLTLRKSASVNAGKVTSASSGDTLKVLERAGDWTRVALQKSGKSQEGWVLTEYIVFSPLVLTLRRSNTSIYSAPDRNSKLISSLAKDTELQVTGTYGNFWVVTVRTASGFLSMSEDVWTSREIQDMFFGAYANPGKGTVNKKTVPRTGPSTGWPEVDAIAAGTEVTLLQETGGWYPCYVKGKVRYILSQDITVTQYPGQGAASASQAQTQTLTLPMVDGVQLVFQAEEWDYDSEKPIDGIFSLSQASELAVEAICQKYGMWRKALEEYHIRYGFHSSAYMAYGVAHPYWKIYFCEKGTNSVIYDVDVDASTGQVLAVIGPGEGNG